MIKFIVWLIALSSLSNFAYSVDRTQSQYLSSIGYVQEIQINFSALISSSSQYHFLGQSVPDSEVGVQEATACHIINQEGHILDLQKGDKLIPGFYGPIKATNIAPMMGLDQPAWRVSILALHPRTDKYLTLKCTTTLTEEDEPSLEEVRHNFESFANVTFTKYSRVQIATSYLRDLQNVSNVDYGRVSDFGTVEAFMYNMCGKLDGSNTQIIGWDRTSSVRRDCLKLVPKAKHLNISAIEACSRVPSSFYRMRSDNIIDCIDNLVDDSRYN